MKRQPKFKVGDRVKVLRASTDAEGHLWCDLWCTPEMNTMIGKNYTIKDLFTFGNYEYPSYDLCEGHGGYVGWRVPEFVLQNKIQVGEQLLLFEL